MTTVGCGTYSRGQKKMNPGRAERSVVAVPLELFMSLQSAQKHAWITSMFGSDPCQLSNLFARGHSFLRNRRRCKTKTNSASNKFDRAAF